MDTPSGAWKREKWSMDPALSIFLLSNDYLMDGSDFSSLKLWLRFDGHTRFMANVLWQKYSQPSINMASIFT